MLRIRIEKQADAVWFIVADTGVGMDEEQISKLLRPAGHRNRGIGLFNTHSLLTRLYGRGLDIQSKPGEGTTVSFRGSCIQTGVSVIGRICYL